MGTKRWRGHTRPSDRERERAQVRERERETGRITCLPETLWNC